MQRSKDLPKIVVECRRFIKTEYDVDTEAYRAQDGSIVELQSSSIACVGVASLQKVDRPTKLIKCSVRRNKLKSVFIFI